MYAIRSYYARAEFTPRSVETTELRTDLVYRLRIVIAESDEGRNNFV